MGGLCRSNLGFVPQSVWEESARMRTSVVEDESTVFSVYSLD